VAILISPTPRAGAISAAAMLSTWLDAGELAVLGVATGSSPSSLYEELVRGGHPFLSELTVFALDEYLGLPPGHSESYRSVINREIAIPFHLDQSRVHVPGEGAPEAYEAAIVEHFGVDVQLLGIGSNGHIGFNEPGSRFDSRTRQVALAESTRVANARFFNSLGEVPTHAVTQGIGTILDARRLLVLAFGATKASAVAAALEGPLTEDLPASALRDHSDVTWILDTAAAERLSPAALQVDFERSSHPRTVGGAS